MLRRAMRMVRQEPPGPDLFWLNRDLAIGGAHSSDEWRQVYEAGVRGVIDLYASGADAGGPVRALGMRYLGLCLEARGVPSPEELYLLSSWANERIGQDGRVLICDSQHRNNDGLVAAATLVKGGLPAYLALTALQRVRPDRRLDFTQSGALVRFAASQPIEDAGN